MDLEIIKEKMKIVDFVDEYNAYWCIVDFKDLNLNFWDKTSGNEVTFTLKDDLTVWRQDDGSAAQDTEREFLYFLYKNDIFKDDFFNILDAKIKKTIFYENQKELLDE